MHIYAYEIASRIDPNDVRSLSFRLSYGAITPKTLGSASGKCSQATLSQHKLDSARIIHIHKYFMFFFHRCFQRWQNIFFFFSNSVVIQSSLNLERILPCASLFYGLQWYAAMIWHINIYAEIFPSGICGENWVACNTTLNLFNKCWCHPTPSSALVKNILYLLCRWMHNSRLSLQTEHRCEKTNTQK